MFLQRQQAIQQKDVFITCVVPVYNEEANVQAFFTELQATLHQLTRQFEIIVVDDGSRDSTIAALMTLPSSYRVKIISFSRNFGKETALTAGLEHASGEVVILMDADFQHPTAVLAEFLRQWGNGYDMVYGARQSRAGESRIKRHASRLFYWLMKKITQIDIPNNGGDFRLMDRKVVNSLNQFQERGRFMKGLYAWVGYKTIAVPFEVQERAGGKSSWGYGRLTELAITGITSFSDIPLRVWGLIGFAISTVALVYALYFMIITLVYGADLPGFPSIIVAVMFLGGIQLLSVGILGEYIARIFTEVKQRPKYLIDLKYGFEQVDCSQEQSVCSVK